VFGLMSRDGVTLGPGWQEGDNRSEFGSSELSSLAHTGGEGRNGI